MTAIINAIGSKKILLSAAVIVAITASVIAATGAFFSDTETSTGNIFTAGSIDLKVDHLKQTYNDYDCTTRCTHWAEEVTSFNQGTRQNNSSVNADRSIPEHATGAAQTSGAQNDGNTTPADFVSLGFGGSIVLHFPDGIDDGVGDDIRIYEGTNGNYPDEKILVEVSPNNSDWTTVYTTPNNVTFDGFVELDLADVEDAPQVYYVRITDISDKNNFNDKPEADGYDLDAVEAIHCANENTDGIPSELGQCQLWEETDLSDQKFFDFFDIKPGDHGTNVISLHVFDNDAYICLLPTDVDDQENSIVDPETEAGDGPAIGNPSGFGELSSEIKFFGWHDNNADGVYQNTEEVLIPAGTPLNQIQTEMVELSLSSSDTGYVSLAWCAGDQTGPSLSDSNIPLDCDGNGMSNIAQTDSAMADLVAYAVQQRNNGDFSCANVDLGGDPQVEEDNH